MPEMAALLKQEYCEADSSECARFLVYQALGRGSVPQDLAPNDHEKARTIIG